MNFAHGNIQAFRCNLDHFRIKTLSHFNTSVRHQNWSISINVHKSATLIQKLKPKGNAKHCWNNCQSSFLPFVFPVIFFNLISTLVRFKIFMALFIDAFIMDGLEELKRAKIGKDWQLSLAAEKPQWEIFLENYPVFIRSFNDMLVSEYTFIANWIRKSITHFCKIDSSNFIDMDAQIISNLANYVFCKKHPLRAPESSKSCVAWSICFASIALDWDPQTARDIFGNLNSQWIPGLLRESLESCNNSMSDQQLVIESPLTNP